MCLLCICVHVRQIFNCDYLGYVANAGKRGVVFGSCGRIAGNVRRLHPVMRSGRFSGLRQQSILRARIVGSIFQSCLVCEELIDAPHCDFGDGGLDDRWFGKCQLDDRASGNGALEGDPRHEYFGPAESTAAFLWRHGAMGASKGGGEG
jgi:hypothetical protein